MEEGINNLTFCFDIFLNVQSPQRRDHQDHRRVTLSQQEESNRYKLLEWQVNRGLQEDLRGDRQAYRGDRRYSIG